MKFEEQVLLQSYELLSNHHHFDFLFILCYTALFMASLLVVLKALDFGVKKKGFVFCILPGVLDGIENILFFGLQAGESSYFEAYYWVVRIKWAVVVPYLQIVLSILLFYALLHLYHWIAFFKYKRV